MSLKKKTFLRVLSVFLVFALSVCPINVSAAEEETLQPYASNYLDSYNAYVYPAGSGKVQVWFTVRGAGYMDDIGCLLIRLYESSDSVNWTLKKSYSHNNYSGMLDHDDYFHSGHVDYNGTAGKYYRAYVCIWAAKDGQGDSRYFYTATKKAT